MLENQLFHVEHFNGGIYIHVPFCVSKCGYCDFCRITDLRKILPYIEALKNEISNRIIGKICPSTVYIGGGTPSCLKSRYLSLLLKNVFEYIDLIDCNEFTIECNPDDVDDDLISLMNLFSVNRVSIGCQSLDDKVLKFMGRRHNSAQVFDAVEKLRKGGIKNISADMIFGIPKVDCYSFEDDIDMFISLRVPHLSVYALSYEEGSVFSRKLHNGLITPLKDDIVADQYELLTDKLKKAGYNHYEISNYSFSGYESKHNSSYWIRKPYYGFGPGASSYIENSRRTNTLDFDEYIKNNGLTDTYNEFLSEKEIYEEVIMLGLRTSEGVCISEIPKSYLIFFFEKLNTNIENGNIKMIDNKRCRIDEDKWFISDSIISSFFV